MQKSANRKLIVAVTGASGSVYARLLLEKLAARQSEWESLGLVMSDNARTVWRTELGDTAYESLPFKVYGIHDFHAPFASGSAGFDTMIVIPCSMGTLGRIAAGSSDDLIARAADVILKERRKLILVVRETPYSLIHIRNMETVTLAGAIVCPATPSFYSRPQSIEAVAATVVDRVLDLAGFDSGGYRWGNP